MDEKRSLKKKEKAAVESDDSEDSEVGDVTELAAVKPGFMEDCKMVLIVRNDLGMTKGKIAAQCGYVCSPSSRPSSRR